MQTRRCGDSDLKVSAITLGLMVRDCSAGKPFESVRQTVLRAIDRGITTIDLATGYGGGTVEQAVGALLKSDLAAHRDRLVIATKAGWADGSRQTLTAGLERSLRQLGVDHVDLYYHHAADARTPFEETAATLADLRRQGKTRYVGISNYAAPDTIRMVLALRQQGTACVLHQCNYNLLNRWVEDGHLQALPALGVSAALFSTLNQGLLSDASDPVPRPASRAEKSLNALVEGVGTGEPAYGRYEPGDVRAQVLAILGQLRVIARDRGQTLEQLALAWVLRHAAVATVLVGMSSPEQVDTNAAATEKLAFSQEELVRINRVLPPRMGLV